MIHIPQPKQQLRLLIQAHRHSIKHRRDVLADPRRIRTGATHRNLTLLRKQSPPLLRQSNHHLSTESPLQQLQQRLNAARTVPLNRLPRFAAQRPDSDGHRVGLTATHDRSHSTTLNHQIRDRSVPHISGTPRQAIGDRTVSLQILTPLLPPECLRQLTTRCLHRTGITPLLLRQLRRRLATQLLLFCR